jgi:cytochrome c
MRLIGITAVAVASLVTVAHADGDVTRGEQDFRICSACHAVGPGAKNKVGPELNGVVGRKWGATEGYNYSSDLTAGKDQGKMWDEATLDDYLTNPKHLVPHGKMGFAGFSQQEKRADVISYLKQFDAQGNKR